MWSSICESGNFLIDSGDIVYCSAEEHCGSKGWRVGVADFRNPCPDGLVVYDDVDAREHQPLVLILWPFQPLVSATVKFVEKY